jgi:crotonobetainyl-CoA:carnitine CoA-transferase CaiB-like acyl-CoA transferase
MAKEINYERLKEVNPSIIVAAVSGYGQTGPDAENPCFDGVAQARAASMVMNGFPGDPICKTGLPYIDVSSGLFAAIGVLLALYHREKQAAGQAVDVSLFDTASFATQSVGTLLLYHLSGEIRKHIGNRGFHSFNGCFKAKDGSVQISTATNSIWKRFMRAIGREDMINDPRFQNDMDRYYRADLIDSMVKDWFEKRTTDEIVQTLQKARVPCGVVKTVDQLIDDPQVKAREMVKFLDYPKLGEVPVPGNPIKLSLTPGTIDTPSPRIGEHNQEVYSGLLGFGPEKVSELRKKGVI